MVNSAFNVERGRGVVIEAQYCLSASEVDVVPVSVLLGDSAFSHVMEESFWDDAWESSLDI